MSTTDSKSNPSQAKAGPSKAGSGLGPQGKQGAEEPRKEPIPFDGNNEGPPSDGGGSSTQVPEDTSLR